MTSPNFIAPQTVAAACEALLADDSHCLAGGQSLVAMMNLGLVSPGRLVSLRKIAALRGIERMADGGLRIGAMTTHAELGALQASNAAASLISRAANVVAYPAVRNCGTIGGSIALADPSADYPVALVAADAIIELASTTGTRRVPARSFFLGMFETALGRGEIVVAIHVPASVTGSGAAYEKLSLVAGDFAIVSVAALAGPRTVTVAVGGCAMKPLLLGDVGLADEAALSAGRKLADECDPPSDHRASSAYRRRVLPELVRRAVHAAVGARR